MFFRKKKTIGRIDYDPEEKTPVIRCSICNGEQVGGLKHRASGEFEEVMLIRDSSDLEIFRQKVWLEDIPKEY